MLTLAMLPLISGAAVYAAACAYAAVDAFVFDMWRYDVMRWADNP